MAADVKNFNKATKTWVEVSTKKERTVMVEQYHPLYSNLIFYTGTGIEHVKPGQRFHIIINKFG